MTTVDHVVTEAHRDCPTPTAHKRLDEGHRWWHGCLEKYDDISAFRANLNACIQALRNVTFVLQKEKRLIKDFDQWYPAWQDKMKSDEIMKWLVASRNRVVKEGDLEINSSAVYRLALDYQGMAEILADSLPDVDSDLFSGRQMSPMTRPIEYARKVRSWPLPSHVLEGATIFVERRWVDVKLPKRELLDALAHAYGVLSLLVADAHSSAGLASSLHVMSGEAVLMLPKLEQHKGRPPCMITTREVRTASYRVLDGSLVGNGSRFTLNSARTLTEKAAARYKIEGVPQRSAEKSYFDHYLDSFMDIAVKILKKDRHHVTAIMYFKNESVVDMESYSPKDRAEKLAMSRHIADRVAVGGFDAVFMIAELWESEAEYDTSGHLIEPVKAASRREALVVYGEDKAGRIASVAQFFKHRFGRIILEERRTEFDESRYRTLEPTRAVWRSWQDLSNE